MLLLLAACTSGRLHRPENVEEKGDYTLTFIEFDDHGEPWAPAQLERTVEVIDEVHGEGKRAVVILFVHGWHNDASKREDRKRDNNVEGFQQLLDTAHQVLRRAGQGPEEVELIGVYLSWRGRSTDVGLLKPLTFYSRRGAGQRAASVSTTEAILRVMKAAKANPGSRGIVIGHSFGGMIVERALVQAVVGYTLDTRTEIRTDVPDMLMLINPASQSMEAKNMVSMFKRNRLKFYREDVEGNRTEAPLIVSVTSTGDSATGNLFPMALSLKAWSKKFRQYEPTDCSPVQKQKEFYTKTAGHNTVLHSHVIKTTGSLDAGGVDDREMVLETSVDPETGETRYSFPGEKNLFTIQGLPFSYNDTPYWIMSAPPELIRDHSDIFTYNTIQMIRALLVLSGASDEAARSIVVREDGVRPLELIGMPDGDLAFLEGSRRIFHLGPDNSRPFGLACLPSVIQPEAVIGVEYEGSRAVVLISGAIKGGEKPKFETSMIGFDLDVVGADSLEWSEIHSDLLFSAATGDFATERAYLTRPGGLYVVDMTLKKPRPELLSAYDETIEIYRMNLDTAGNRILAIDREGGSLYGFDLSAESPSAELLAEDLGPVTELDLVPTESTVLLLVPSEKRVLVVDCPRDSSECSAPETFAAIPEFEQPITVARTTDGTVWVGDLSAQSIFAFDSDGQLVRVLDSMSGFAD